MKKTAKDFTLEEKAKLVVGKDCWRINDLNGKLKQTFMADGPCGLRKINDDETTVSATLMPSVSVVANSWSKELAYLDGETIASDCVENDVDVLLAPGVNIKRSPLCGRNFEYFSEDPFLAGELAKSYIEGVQSNGIGTSLKHYCCNNSDYDRLFQSSEVDERTMREIYLPAFEKAVEADPYTVMCAYNPVNGVQMCENKKLLTGVLKNEFGFNGAIVSDWGAVHGEFGAVSAPKAIKAGLDLIMPYEEKKITQILDAVKSGFLTEEELDKSVDNVLKLIERTKNANKKVSVPKSERHVNAKKIAAEGMVLLKNEGALPIKSGKVAVEGSCAKDPVTCGGGSAKAHTLYTQKSLANLLNDCGTKAEFAESCIYLSHDTHWGLSNLYKEAYASDAIILCVSGVIESEGRNRTSVKLSQNIEDTIIRTADFNKNVIVVLYGGSAIDMTAWIDKVNAVLYAGYAGEACNEAVAEILTGKVVPSGKLAETFPLCIEDTYVGTTHGNGFAERYTDGVFVGYRYYDTEKKNVLFPFGHGLSYAKFTYSDLEIEKKSETDYVVSYVIKNESDFDAKEISQVYVKDVFAAVSRPEKELKGFSKNLIKAHESKRVSVELNYRSFAYYSVPLEKWHVENGAFEILVGASSRDIKLVGKININLPEETQVTVV